MYRRHGTDTYATSYVRHVHASDPPGFEYLSASSNGTRMPPPEHTPKDGCISGNNGLYLLFCDHSMLLHHRH